MAKKKKPNDLYREKPKHPNQYIYLTLDLPPSQNHMFIHTKRGAKILTKKAKEYVENARKIIRSEIQEQEWIQEKNPVWYYVDLFIYMPDRRVRDSHNMEKLLLDIFEGLIYVNDYYAMPRIQLVEYDKENPRLETLIRPQSEVERERIKGDIKKYKKEPHK